MYGCAISQKLPGNNFECIEGTFQFNEDFIKSYTKESDKGYFPKFDVHYTNKLHGLHNDITSLRKACS